MENNYYHLYSNTLFDKIKEEDIEKMLKCLSFRERKIEAESFVFSVGDRVRFVYIILSGSFHIIDEDYWGNRSIIETMRENILFGEAYVFSDRKTQLVSVVAAEDSVLLEIDPVKLFHTCSETCACHTQLTTNALKILSEKIVRLTEKVGHVGQRTMREKILSYLSKCARIEGKSSFYIPYSRQQLADYLCVDRSALSHELSRLKDEGIILYKKNFFELLP